MRFLAAFCLACLFAPLAQAACDPGEKEIRFIISPSDEDAARDRAARGLVDDLNRDLQGAACANLVLETSSDDAESSLNGLPELGNMAFPSLNTLALRANGFRAFTLPFAFRGRLAVERFYNGPVREILDRSAEAAGLKTLGLLHDTMAQMVARIPLVVADDVLGKKIALDGSRYFAPFLSGAGAPPQDIAPKDWAAALQDGRVDAVSAPWRDIGALVDAEKKPANILETNHRYDGYVLVANSDWWNSLPDDLQERIEATIAKALGEANAFNLTQEMNARTALLRGETPVLTLTELQRRQWWSLSATLLEALQDVIGSDDLAAAIAASNIYP